MREIKFRGMDLEGNWHYGNLAILPENIRHLKKGHYISNSDGLPFAYQVRPETVGQYTGMKNNAGKEIYEDDILRVFEVSETKSLEYTSPVEFIDSSYLVTQPDGCQVPLACFHNPESSYPLFEIEVVGNIHDNPELLGGESHG